MINADIEKRTFVKQSNLLKNSESINLTNFDEPQSFFFNTQDIIKNIRSTKDFSKNNKIILPKINKHVFTNDITSINKNLLIDFSIDSCNTLFLLEKKSVKAKKWVIKSILNNGDLIDTSIEVSSVARKIVCSAYFVFVLENYDNQDIISVFSKDYLKLQFKINDFDDPIIDFDVDSNGNMVILGAKLQKITIEKSQTNQYHWEKIDLYVDHELTNGDFLSVDKTDNIYVLSPKKGKLFFLSRQENAENFEKVGYDISKENYTDFEAYDPKNIFICYTVDGILHEPMKVKLLENKVSPKLSIDINQPSEKLVSTKIGDIIVLSESKNTTLPIIQKLQKFELIKTFKSNSEIKLLPIDSTHEGTNWHKIMVNMDVDLKSKKTSIIISYTATDTIVCSNCGNKFKEIEKLKEHISEIHKTQFTPDKIHPPSKQFEELVPNPENALLNTIGRFLWINVKLMTLDREKTPTLNSMRIYFPRTSYLRYLPNVYARDPSSKEFLEKFLSLFEDFFNAVDKKIFNFHNLLDPKTTPIDFLPWFSAMLGVSYNDQWQELNFRNMLRKLPQLYKKRGTRDGLIDLLLTFLMPNLISEHEYKKKNKTPIMLFENFQLKCLKGNDSDYYKEHYDLYGTDPNIFSVLIDEDLLDAQKLDVVREIVENEKPAHTLANICPLTNWFYLGTHTYLGLNTVLGDPTFVVGTSALSRDTRIN